MKDKSNNGLLKLNLLGQPGYCERLWGMDITRDRGFGSLFYK